MTLISIIVPCYNQAQYLSECLQSVLNQTYTNWECIIVNDGSLDNTEEIALSWTERDSRIKYIKKENGGVSAARNTGIKQAQGEWILPLDGDDKIAEEYLEQAYKIILSHPNVGLIYANAEFFGEKNESWNLMPYSYQTLLRSNIIYCSALYKKADWTKTEGYDTSMKHGWEDWEFWINLIGTSQKEVYRLNYTGFYYRIKKQSRNESFDKNKTQQNKVRKYVLKKHLDMYLENFGTIQSILDLNDNLKKENIDLKYRLDRYDKNSFVKIINKLYRLYKKLKQK